MTTDRTTGKLTVYVDAPDGYLYALDAATGATVWKNQLDVPGPNCAYYAFGSPLVANGNVYIGISDDARAFINDAGLRSVNQSTGATVANWHVLPPATTARSVWASPALASNGTIIVGTANGKPYGGSQPLYDESIVDLNPNTLALESGWQVQKSEQIGDGDFGASPTMFSATLNGVSTPMVGDCNKNGIYDRVPPGRPRGWTGLADADYDPHPGSSKSATAWRSGTEPI